MNQDFFLSEACLHSTKKMRGGRVFRQAGDTTWCNQIRAVIVIHLTFVMSNGSGVVLSTNKENCMEDNIKKGSVLIASHCLTITPGFGVNCLCSKCCFRCFIFLIDTTISNR